MSDFESLPEEPEFTPIPGAPVEGSASTAATGTTPPAVPQELASNDGIHFTSKTGRRLRLQYGPYRVKDVIGEGGMGAIVLEAEDLENPGRDVALKVISPDRRMTHEMRRRFIRGGRASAGVDHPNVVKIFATGEEAGRPWFAMELVRGATVGKLIERDGKIPVHRAVDIVLQAARGLAAAAAHGVIHRDVKPENLLVSNEGQVKLTDFGIASIEQQESIFLHPGIIVGTPLYMSPEMCQAQEVDHRSDIYSLGITFYEMLTGKPPFHGTPVDVMYKHSHKRVRSVAQRVPTLHPRVARIVMSMLAKKPTGRYADYASLIADLEDVQRLGHFTVPSRRRPGWVTMTVIGIAAGICVGLWLGYRVYFETPDVPETPTPPPVTPNKEPPPVVEDGTLLPILDGDFDKGEEPTLDVPGETGWRFLATGALADTPEKIVKTGFDAGAGGGELDRALRLEITAAQPLVATLDLGFPTDWGLSTRLVDVKALEGTPIELRFMLRGTGKAPQLVVRFEETPARDTPFPAHAFPAAEAWSKHDVDYLVEPSSSAEHALTLRFFVAGDPGDTIWLDSVELRTR